jgi:hypothetical protein
MYITPVDICIHFEQCYELCVLSLGTKILLRKNKMM